MREAFWGVLVIGGILDEEVAVWLRPSTLRQIAHLQSPGGVAKVVVMSVALLVTDACLMENPVHHLNFEEHGTLVTMDIESTHKNTYESQSIEKLT